MDSWGWLLVGLSAGAIVGLVMAAILRAGVDEDKKMLDSRFYRGRKSDDEIWGG